MNGLHELGILFVHGIGEQTRGQALIQFGDPLIQTLDNWLQLRKGSVEPVQSALSSRSNEPANAVFRIHSSTGAPATWLLAESWWAADFQKPQFSKLAGWLLTTGAWAMLIHAFRPAHLDPRPRFAIVRTVLRIALAILLAWLLQISVVLLSLLAWIPIPKFRRLLSSLLLNLSGTIGDSFVLLESKTQRAAALETTRRSLLWLAERSHRVVVIGHSQGARIAYAVLADLRRDKADRDQQGSPLVDEEGASAHVLDKVGLLITFGSAISKLVELEATARTEAASFARIALIFALYCACTFPRVMQISSPQFMYWYLYTIAPLMMMAAAFHDGWHVSRQAIDRVLRFTIKPIRWVDLYTSHDLVPNGPLRSNNPADLFQGFEVVNRRSTFTDHSTYWENRDEFVYTVLREIDRVGRQDLFSPDDPEYPAVHRIRQRRVAVLWLVRLASIIAVPLLVYGLRRRIPDFGEGVFNRIGSNALTEPFGRTLTGLGWIFVSPILAMGFADKAMVSRLGDALGGVAVLSALVLIWYTFCSAPAWSLWERNRMRARNLPVDPSLFGQISPTIGVLLTVAVGFVPIAMGIASVLIPEPAVLLRNSLDIFVMFYPLCAALVMIGMLLASLFGLLRLIAQPLFMLYRWWCGRRVRS